MIKVTFALVSDQATEEELKDAIHCLFANQLLYRDVEKRSGPEVFFQSSPIDLKDGYETIKRWDIEYVNQKEPDNSIPKPCTL